MNAGRLGIAGLLMLASCGDRGPERSAERLAESGSERTAALPPLIAAPPASKAPRRAFGNTSPLSGTTSVLTGTITGFAVTVTDTTTIVALAADTLFAFDKATVEPGAAVNLARTAELVAKGATGAVRVIGHTDAKGDDAYNRRLSLARAQAIATWLHARPGLEAREMRVEGAGETQPVALNTRADGTDDPAGRARNRRVEVIIPK